MAQQQIDFGSFPNDPSADAIRAAFQKIQTNFTELYNTTQSTGVSSVTAGAGLGQTRSTGQVVLVANIPNITIQTSDSLLVGVGVASGNKATVASYSTPFKLDLAPNITTSNGRFTNTLSASTLVVTNGINSNLIPSLDSTYNLGSATKRWKTLYIAAQTIDLGGALIGNDGSNITLNKLSVASNIVSSSVTSASVSSPTINVGAAVLTSDTGGVLQVTNMTVTNQFTTNNVVINNNLNVTNNITVYNITSSNANIGGTIIDSSGTITIKQAPIDTLSASSNNVTGISTITFADQGYAPYVEGQTITIIGVLPAGFNGVKTVKTATNTSVTFDGTTAGPQTRAGAITSGGTITLGGAGGTIQVGNTTLDQTGALTVGNTTITPEGAITSAGTTPDFHAPGNDSELLFNSGGNTSAISAVKYNASTNLLSIAGNVQGGNLVATGVLSITLGANIGGTANVGNLVSVGTASITGTANVGNLVTPGNANISGTATANTLNILQGANVTGIANVGSLISTSTANIAGTANVGNLITPGSANVAGTANVGNLVSIGIATISGTANVGNLITPGSANVTGTANVGNLISQGAANISGTANVGALVSTSTADITGTANVGNLISVGTASVLGNHYVTSSTSVGGDQNIGTSISITSLTPNTPAAGNVRVTFTNQGYIPFIQNQTVTITGVTTTLAYNTTYSVYSATATSVILTSTQTGTAVVTNAKISGGGNLTMTGTHTAGSLTSLGNATIVATANVGNLVSQGAANVAGTANVGNLTTPGNATVAGVHYIGASGTAVGSNVLVANGDARTVGTHFMATANITNGFTSGYHVIGSGAQSGSNLLTVIGSSYTSGTHTANNVNVATNHIVGGNIVIGGTGVVQSGNSLTVTGNSYISSSHTVGGNSTTTGRHVIVGTGITGNALSVTGNAGTSGTHTMGNAIIAGTHSINGAGNALSIANNANIGGIAYMGDGVTSGTHTISGTGNALTVTNDARIDGTAYIGIANLGTAIFTNGVVGSGSQETNNVFTARGNVFVSGTHYANNNSITIGSHVVGNATPVAGYVFTANGNSFTSTDHFVGGNSNTAGTHRMAAGVSSSNHYVGSGSLSVGTYSNIFGVNGSAYTAQTHTMGNGITTGSHTISGTGITGNALSVTGNAGTSGTHTMGNSVTVGTHAINGTVGNALSVGGNAVTVNTHYMGYGVTTGTHVIGGPSVSGNSLIVSGNANVSGNHYISGFSAIGGARQDTNTQLSVTGNSYTSTHHTVGGNSYVTNFMTTGTTTPASISDGSGSGTYHMTINGNGYVKDSHYVGGYSVIGGGSRKGSNILSITGSTYTSGTHTVETGVSNVFHYVGPSGVTNTAGTVLLANGNVYTVNNHVTGGNHTTVGTHIVGPTGTIVASGVVLHAVGDANTTGTHFTGNSNTAGTHYIGASGITVGSNVLVASGSAYISQNHSVGGNIIVGGSTQSGSNALTVTGSGSISGNHTVAGNASTGQLHSIAVTNPYAYPFGAIPSQIVAGQITGIVAAGGTATVTYTAQTVVPFVNNQTITLSGVTGGFSIFNGTYQVTGTPTTTQVRFAFQGSATVTSTYLTSAIIQHQSTLSVQGIVTVQGNASMGNITAVSSISGGVVTLSGDSSGNALLASGIVRIGGNHTVSGTHTIGNPGITPTSVITGGWLNPGVTMTFPTQGYAPFVKDQIITLQNGGSVWGISGGDGSLAIQKDYIVATANITHVTFGVTGTNKVTGTQPSITTFGQILSSPSNPSMQVNGGANLTGNINIGNATSYVQLFANGSANMSGTFKAQTFTGTYANANLDGSTGYKYTALAGAPNVSSYTSTQAAVAGGSFSYDTATGFNFKPALTYKVNGTLGSAVAGGNLTLSGDTFTFSPASAADWNTLTSKPTTFTPPIATASALGGIKVGGGLQVDGTSGIATANVQSVSGTGTAAGGITATNNNGIFALTLPQAIATANSVQFGGLQLGTSTTASQLLLNYGQTNLNGAVFIGPSGAPATTTYLTVYGAMVAYDNITAYQTSDITFKENIRPIPDALPKVLNIGGKLFDWKDSYLTERGGEDEYFYRKQDFGVIANDVLKYFPEAARTKPDGTLAVDYEKLAALAFQAIVEQEENHKQDIQSLQDQIDTIMNLLKDKK
jgi:hypothetical protein